jgi:hypothetical protein
VLYFELKIKYQDSKLDEKSSAINVPYPSLTIIKGA